MEMQLIFVRKFFENKAKRSKKFYFLVIVITSIFIIAGITWIIQPITFRPSFLNKLTPRIIGIEDTNGNRRVTITVEVTYNHWKPVKGAGVSIYGYSASDTNHTNEDGLATLHLNVGFTNAYLSMTVWKDNKIITKDPAIKIVNDGGCLEWYVI